MTEKIKINEFQKPLCNLPNCTVYNQLKHKEQECERLKEKNEFWEGYCKISNPQLHKIILRDIKLKAENEKLKQYKASKQASYETMQIEWNEAKNEVKQLKAEVKKYKQLANSFEADFFNALSNKESNYVKKLKHDLQEILDEARDGYSSGTQTGCEKSLQQIIEICEEVK